MKKLLLYAIILSSFIMYSYQAAITKKEIKSCKFQTDWHTLSEHTNFDPVITYLAAHEAAHAVSYARNYSLVQIKSASIKRSGRSVGCVKVEPFDSFADVTRQEITNRIMTCLAGAAAEQFFANQQILSDKKDILSLLSNITFIQDVQNARQYAEEIIYNHHELFEFVTNDYEMALAIDDILVDVYKKTYEFIQKHAFEVQKLALLLMNNMEVSGDEIYNLLGMDKSDACRVVMTYKTIKYDSQTKIAVQQLYYPHGKLAIENVKNFANYINFYKRYNMLGELILDTIVDNNTKKTIVKKYRNNKIVRIDEFSQDNFRETLYNDEEKITEIAEYNKDGLEQLTEYVKLPDQSTLKIVTDYVLNKKDNDRLRKQQTEYIDDVLIDIITFIQSPTIKKFRNDTSYSIERTGINARSDKIIIITDYDVAGKKISEAQYDLDGKQMKQVVFLL